MTSRSTVLVFLCVLASFGLPGGSRESRAASPAAVDAAERLDWTTDGDQAGAEFGSSVASAGDVNGDGFDDVVVGAQSYANGQLAEGRAALYPGSARGLSRVPAWEAEGNDQNAHFGGSVGSAGDVNGDGYDDVIVGAYGYSNPQGDEGKAFLYLGSPSGLSKTSSWTNEGNQVDAWYGYSVGSAGDVNGDGFDDVIVGAPYADSGEFLEGEAFLYLGSAAGLSESAAWIGQGGQPRANFGNSVSKAGDVNGDGFDDVIVGAPGSLQPGSSYVFEGSPAGLPDVAAWTGTNGQDGDAFGYAVGTAGDVNGDGYDDVIVGAPYFDQGQTTEGGAFVYLGSPSGLSNVPLWTTEGNQGGAFLGNAVATAGDVNGDGYDEVIVGASEYDGPDHDEGRSFLFPGSGSGPSTTSRVVQANQADAKFGISVATAGDVNGDGLSDVIIGAKWYDHGETNEGAAFAFYG